MKNHNIAAGLAALALCAGTAQAQIIHLNEIYIDQAATDTGEYIELVGTPNASLAGFMVLIVEGDESTPASTNGGILKKAHNLSALSMQGSGYFLLADTGVTPKDFDMGVSNTIENGAETFYLIQTSTPALWTGLVGQHVDSPLGSSTTSIATDPNTTIVDIIAVNDGTAPPAADVWYDGAMVLGPYVDAMMFNHDPYGIYRCADFPGAWSNTFLDIGGANATPLNMNPTDCGGGPSGSSFCFGDGLDPNVTTPCPCGNFGQPGYGCGNSVATTGALLTVTGTTTPDTIQLTISDVPPGVGCIYLQGSALISAGVVFGDGIRCAGGQLIRLGLKNDTDLDGSTTIGPATGDPEIGGTGGTTSGNTYYYQCYYRNPNPTWCPPATFNASQGFKLLW